MTAVRYPTAPERPIAELTAVLSRETNPAPLKQALAFLGLMAPAVRLPLVRLSEPHRIELSEVLFRLCHEHAKQTTHGHRGNYGAVLARHVWSLYYRHVIPM